MEIHAFVANGLTKNRF